MWREGRIPDFFRENQNERNLCMREALLPSGVFVFAASFFWFFLRASSRWFPPNGVGERDDVSEEYREEN